MLWKNVYFRMSRKQICVLGRCCKISFLCFLGFHEKKKRVTQDDVSPIHTFSNLNESQLNIIWNQAQHSLCWYGVYLHTPGKLLNSYLMFAVCSIRWPRGASSRCFESCSRIPRFPANRRTFVACPMQLRCCFNHENIASSNFACFAPRGSFFLL